MHLVEIPQCVYTRERQYTDKLHIERDVKGECIGAEHNTCRMKMGECNWAEREEGTPLCERL